MPLRTSGRTTMLFALIGAVSGCGSEDLFSPAREQRDIAKEARARIAADDQELGHAVVVGDLDGDGIADAIIGGSYLEGPGGTLHERLYVLYGGDLTGDIAPATLPSLVLDPARFPSL